MVRQLVLHGGDCKTGSTILQTMLAREDCTPEGVTLFTPGNGNHGGLARGLGDKPELYPQRWRRTSRRVLQEDCDLAVLSSELFEFIAPDKVAAAVTTHFPDHAADMRVILYIRPHVSRVLSQFAENVKLGHSMGNLADFVEGFIKSGRLSYSDRLARWQAAFDSRLTVRPFVRADLALGDVRHDFLRQVLGDTPYSLRDSGQDDNAALPVPDLALMRYLQSVFASADPLPMDNRVVFGKQYGRLLRDDPRPERGAKLKLTRALYDRLRTACLDDAKEMDRRWFAKPCFEMALEQAGQDLIASEQSLEAEDYFAPETLRQANAWARLLLRQMDDPPEDFGKRLRNSSAAFSG